MSALDGKITIERGLRPCMVCVPAKLRHIQNTSTQPGQYIIEQPEYELKALFHCYHPATGNAIVEYEDGTIHEVEPTQIRFVDNAMSEYAFPEMEEKFMCKYCCEDGEIITGNTYMVFGTKMAGFLMVEGNKLMAQIDDETIAEEEVNYCPFCGRKLSE